MDVIQIGDFIFPTVLALTAKEHARGLMFVKNDPPVMSFIYNKASVNKMWMKNTFVPLDMLFCHDGKVVAVAHGTPHSEELVGPDVLSDMVVEMPTGSIEKFNITVGTPISVSYSTNSLARKISARYL